MLASSALTARPDESSNSSWQHWLDLERYTQGMRRQGAECSFYRAVLALRQGEKRGHVACQQHIDAARLALYEEVASLVSESYSRAYGGVLQLQRLAELEEVIASPPRSLPPCTDSRLAASISPPFARTPGGSRLASALTECLLSRLAIAGARSSRLARGNAA